MQTTDLIEQLAADLRPVPVRAAAMRIGVGLLVGAALSVAAVLLTMRVDVRAAVQTPALWIKWAYGLSTLSIALALCLRFARPEHASGRLVFALAAPLLIISAAALAQLSATPRAEWAHQWLGHSALMCPWLILGLAIPLFAGVLWAFRKFAPTQPRVAGFVSGALSGAAASVVYALACDETGVAFVATWYTLGMLLPAAAGALLGPRVLRW